MCNNTLVTVRSLYNIGIWPAVTMSTLPFKSADLLLQQIGMKSLAPGRGINSKVHSWFES
jgi:hypothetical protein